MSTRIALLLSFVPLSFLSLPLGPTESEIPSLLAGVKYFAADPILSRKISRKWKMGQTATKNYK
jgi:hypothetical protein